MYQYFFLFLQVEQSVKKQIKAILLQLCFLITMDQIKKNESKIEKKKHSHGHGHSHSHIHSHDIDDKGMKVAFFLNLSFAIIEVIGGFWTNSVAIISDAIHDFGDSLSMGMAWYLQKVAKKKPDQKYTYGYKRFSLVGALVNSIVLIVGSIYILNEAIPRLFRPEETNASGMVLLAIFGVIVNGAAVLRLRHGKSLNERVVSLHLIEDVLGWVAVLIGAVVMYFTDWYIIDPILSVLIALFILSNIYKNMRELFRILLQGTPYEVDLDTIRENLGEIEKVDSVHDLHVWSVDGMYNVVTVHVVLKADHTMYQLIDLKKRIREVLLEEGIDHATIEFETMDEKCHFEDCAE